MFLRDYLKAESLSYGEFARRIGAKNARTVQRYVEGARIPRPDKMERIGRETGGRVGPADFYAQPSVEGQ